MFPLQVDTIPQGGMNILTDLARLSPLIGLLVVVVIYLIWKLEKKEKEVVVLNEYIRHNDRDNLLVLTNVNNTLDKVIENQKSGNSSMSQDIDRLKEYIDLRMEKPSK